MTSVASSADVAVLGGGIVGLSVALAAADRGLRVLVLDHPTAGRSWAAAAGLLAPSVGQDTGPARDFAIAARDRYPSFVASLADRGGIDVPLSLDGVLQVALGDRGVRGLRRAMPDSAEWVEPERLRDLEPALAHARGAVLHPRDGTVDPDALYRALWATTFQHPNVRRRPAFVAAISAGADGVTVHDRGGDSIQADRVVLATGAWSAKLRGVPRELPIEPVRGELLEWPVRPLRRAVFGPTGYVVPRGADGTVGGSTAERVGFDASTTDAGRRRIEATAAAITPLLRTPPVAHRAGLRPMTPDGRPLLGADPLHPAVVYACGHSRNGVLLAPLTGDCIASVLMGEPTAHDLSPFAPDRFHVASSER